jgi:hypothetical protein
VRGVVLLNPWVRGEQTLARSLLFNYYRERLFNREAWRALLQQRAKLGTALGSLARTAVAATAANRNPAPRDAVASPARSSAQPLLPRVAAGLEKFRGAILLVIAGTDITGGEFVQGIARQRSLRRRLAKPNVTRQVLQAADHTFSTAAWRDQVARWTREWLDGLPPE